MAEQVFSFVELSRTSFAELRYCHGSHYTRVMSRSIFLHPIIRAISHTLKQTALGQPFFIYRSHLPCLTFSSPPQLPGCSAGLIA